MSGNVIPYCDAEYADAYFNERLNADAWAAANDETKHKALVTATRLIRDYAIFYDEYDHPVQLNPEDPPPQVCDATAEEALYLLNLGFDPTQPKKVLTLGIVTTEGTTFDRNMTAAIIGEQAARLLKNAGAELLESSGDPVPNFSYFTK